MRLIVVTGLSGSGKTIALHTLEDLDYYCIDNLPVWLLGNFGEQMARRNEAYYRRSAIGIDARNPPSSLEGLAASIQNIRNHGIEVRILFLDAEPDILIRRFSETRRKHPLTQANCSLAEAIQLERRRLEPLLDIADLRIDTTHTNVHQLRDRIRQQVMERPHEGPTILLESFGFKHGVPREVDFVFDMRALPNPHWHPGLRSLTGLDPAVSQYLDAQPEVQAMSNDLSHFLEHWIPRFAADGRNYLTIAIGCTGGQHRSPYMTKTLERRLGEKGITVLVRHRELS